MSEFSYRVKDNLLNTHERLFYDKLKVLAGMYNLHLYAKPRIADFIEPTTSEVSLRDILTRHVDFLLCDAHSDKPILAIEQDGKSHAAPESKNDEDIKNKIFKGCGLKLIRVCSYKCKETKPSDFDTAAVVYLKAGHSVPVLNLLSEHVLKAILVFRNIKCGCCDNGSYILTAKKDTDPAILFLTCSRSYSEQSFDCPTIDLADAPSFLSVSEDIIQFFP